VDIRDRSNLGGVVYLVKDFKLSKSLIVKARKLGFPLRLIKTTREFGGVLEQRNWRSWPMVFDVPSTCQVFGRFVMNAGIEGILYNSTITKRACLAIFPQNFLNSSSFIELDDAVPDPKVRSRIDSNNFKDVI